MRKRYMPPDSILQKYADLLVHFALNKQRKIQAGDKILIEIPYNAVDFLDYLRQSVTTAGAHCITRILPPRSSRWYEYASDEQLSFISPSRLTQFKEADYRIRILTSDAAVSIDPALRKRVQSLQAKAIKPFWELYEHKQQQGMGVVLALWGTELGAKNAGLSLSEYWEEIINACYLREEYPVACWKDIFQQIDRRKRQLDDLAMDYVHVVGKDMDLKVKLGPDRKWLGATGRNIPSYEQFTSPDWRGTEGWIRFSQPLYYKGSKIENIRLVFKKGEVVEATSDTCQDILRSMIAIEGMNRVGEFSLTEASLSNIRRLMAETLYDENVGGDYGNMHIALGSCYKTSYRDDSSGFTKEDWDARGFNDAAGHEDIVSTTNRKVYAGWDDKDKRLIYQDGAFTL